MQNRGYRENRLSGMNITFRQMRYFLAVAEARSISGGSAVIRISQSAVTDAIRFLEAEIGHALFVRHAKGVTLTREGQQFQRQARKVMAAMADLRSGIGSGGSQVDGSLLIGTTPVVTGYFLSDLLARFRQAFPDVKTSVVENRTDFIEHMLVNGELDLAILIVPGLTRPEALDHEVLLRSEMRVWMAPGHRFADNDTISLSDLAAEPLIMLARDELASASANVWSGQKFQAQTAFRSSSVEAVRGLVATNGGVAILPDLVYRPWSLEGDRILAKRTREQLPTVNIALVWRRLTHHSEAATMFMETARGTRSQR
jgi:DNA-binding transcriptional LysR family regulator